MESRRVASDKGGAIADNATLVFIDESGFTERPPVRRTWAPRGQTPVIRHHFNWKRINSVGAIACKGDGTDRRLLLHLQKEAVNTDTAVSFLKSLQQEINGQIVVVWDGLPAHRSNAVKEHIDQNRDSLSVERFPAYAPELNPVEYLWSAMKGKDIANFCSESIQQVEHKVEQAAHRVENSDTILQGFLKASTLYDDRTLVQSKGESLQIGSPAGPPVLRQHPPPDWPVCHKIGRREPAQSQPTVLLTPLILFEYNPAEV